MFIKKQSSLIRSDLQKNCRKLGILPWISTSFLFLGCFLWLSFYFGFFRIHSYSAFTMELANLSNKSPRTLIKANNYEPLSLTENSDKNDKALGLKFLDTTDINKNRIISLESYDTKCKVQRVENKPKKIKTYVEASIQDWWITSPDCQPEALFAFQVVRTSKESLKTLASVNNPNNIFLLEKPNIYVVAYTYRNYSLNPTFKSNLSQHKKELIESLESNLKFIPSKSIDSYRDQEYTYYLSGKCRGGSECKIIAIDNFDGKVKFIEDHLTNQLKSLNKKVKAKISRKQNIKNSLIITLEKQSVHENKKTYTIVIFDKQSGNPKKPKKLDLEDPNDKKLLKYF